LLFDGYEDPLLNVILKSNDPAIPKPPFTKMGWFVERNNSETYDGKFRMQTGVDDIANIGNLLRWNDKPSTELYGSCSNIHGSSGELFGPLINDSKANVSIFAPDICRNIDMKFESKTSKLGVDGYKWVADDSVFDNGIKYPEKICYCSADKKECPDLAAGLFNASSCKWNSPAFVSFPHFYLADKIYREKIDGMKPNKEQHEFSISLEPTTGIPLSVDAALQINLLISEWETISMFQNVSANFIPMFWFKQRAQLTPELASRARLALNLPNIGLWVAYALLGVGLLMSISTVLCFVYRWRNAGESEDDEEPILNDQ
jgi:hypothetical protein